MRLKSCWQDKSQNLLYVIFLIYNFFVCLEHSEFIRVFKGGEELVLVAGWAEGVSVVWLSTERGKTCWAR